MRTSESLTIDVRPPAGDAVNVIEQDELRQAFLALAVEVPEPYELAGVTFHGFASPLSWVAFLSDNPDAEPPLACEAWGMTPLAALQALRAHMREEHPEQFGAIRP